MYKDNQKDNSDDRKIAAKKTIEPRPGTCVNALPASRTWKKGLPRVLGRLVRDGFMFFDFIQQREPEIRKTVEALIELVHNWPL